MFSTNLNLVSRPLADWQFAARARRYAYDNRMPDTIITDYIAYNTSPSKSATGGPERFAHSRTTVDADATWTRLRPFGITAGYTRNENGYDFRIFDSAAENVWRVSADAVGSQWAMFHAKYEHAKRTGSGLNEHLLVEIGEQPAMRHFDLANRTRNQATGIVDFVPNDRWTFSVSGGAGRDEFPGSYFGLQEATFRTISFAVDYHQANGIDLGGTYNFERYGGLQRSRSANPGQETDPNRDWTADSLERVNYFSLYAAPPRIGNTEARVYYDFSYAKGTYVYTVVPGGPLPAPSQLPRVFNQLQQLHVDVRHRLTNHLAGTLNYYYEPFRVFDFAFDQSVVNSIDQPSSLVLGYIYRPYTMHSAVLGIRYRLVTRTSWRIHAEQAQADRATELTRRPGSFLARIDDMTPQGIATVCFCIAIVSPAAAIGQQRASATREDSTRLLIDINGRLQPVERRSSERRDIGPSDTWEEETIQRPGLTGTLVPSERNVIRRIRSEWLTAGGHRKLRLWRRRVPSVGWPSRAA